jgi:hypothetical protein
MKRFLTIVSALCICAVMATGAFAGGTGPQYGWTVSKSAVDPLINSGLPTGGVDTLFLWFYCSTEGMASAEMDVVSTPAGQVIAFNVSNGYLNAGNATHLLLAVGGCPSAPVVAGSILVLHFAPLIVCLEGANVTVDCSPNPQAWPHDHKGYADLALPLCLSDSPTLCQPVSVEESSWGSIKSLYR